MCLPASGGEKSGHQSGHGKVPVGPTAGQGAPGHSSSREGTCRHIPSPVGLAAFPLPPKNSPERPRELLGKSMAKLFFFLSCQSPKCLIPPRSRNVFLQGLLGGGASGRRLPYETLRNTKSFPRRRIGQASQKKEGQNDGVDRQTASCTPAFTTAAHSRPTSGSSAPHVTNNMGGGRQILRV